MGKKLTADDAARGQRLRSIREARGLTQEEMVPLLNQAAERLGLAVRYKYYTVSRIESGSISFEDAAVWLSLDPSRDKASDPLRWDWLVFGERKGGKLRPRPSEHPNEAGGGGRRSA